jgi:hypothetical protein
VVCVGDGDGERIGGVGAGDLHAREQARDHSVDLYFLGAAGANHGFLDQRRGIFADLYSRSCGAHQSDAARLAELERRLRVLVDEDLLDCGCGRGMVGDHSFELVGERGEAARQRSRRVGLDLAVRDVGKAIAFGLDQPPAGGAETRVEAEDDQPSRSSSSSGTS